MIIGLLRDIWSILAAADQRPFRFPLLLDVIRLMMITTSLG